MKKEWPRNPTHNRFIDTIKEILKEEGEISRNELAEKVGNSEVDVAEATAKAYLSTNRQYLDSEDNLSSREKPDGSPGHTTVYWSYKE
jgi:hypothetical protein